MADVRERVGGMVVEIISSGGRNCHALSDAFSCLVARPSLGELIDLDEEEVEAILLVTRLILTVCPSI